MLLCGTLTYMKNILALFKNLESFSFLFGMVFGAALGLVLFSYLVPGGTKAIATYRAQRGYKLATLNQGQMEQLYASSTNETTNVVCPTVPKVSYSCASVKISSEKQFLEQIKSHHDLEISVASQALSLKSIHPEVKTFAKNIISTEATELKMIKDWLAAWK